MDVAVILVDVVVVLDAVVCVDGDVQAHDSVSVSVYD